MQRVFKIHALLTILVIQFLLTQFAFAWTQQVDFGYGYSHDPNDGKYNNSGFLLSSNVAPLYINNWTHWSLNLSAGKWRTTAPINKNLATFAASVQLRLYPISPYCDMEPYILGSAGPTYMSNNDFGTNQQGSHVSGQWIAGLGFEYKKLDVSFHMVHFSNAKLSSPDDGFNILYMLSVGYLFSIC